MHVGLWALWSACGFSFSCVVQFSMSFPLVWETSYVLFKANKHLLPPSCSQSEARDRKQLTEIIITLCAYNVPAFISRFLVICECRCMHEREQNHFQCSARLGSAKLCAFAAANLSTTSGQVHDFSTCDRWQLACVHARSSERTKNWCKIAAIIHTSYLWFHTVWKDTCKNLN